MYPAADAESEKQAQVYIIYNTMQQLLKQKLRAYLQINNPDLLLKLEGEARLHSYLEDKISLVTPMLLSFIADGKPGYVIEELIMTELTADLRPSRFNYIKELLEEDFKDSYLNFLKAGVLTYESINLVEHCREAFDTFSFSEENEDDRLLRYAIIAKVHEYLN